MLTVTVAPAIELRAQLAAAIDPQTARAYPDPTAGPQNANQPPNIDPQIAAAAAAAAAAPAMMNNSGDGSLDDQMVGADGRKAGKRELSQSKRAAQNRAAQRAFRQRKEGYIKKLEQQVNEFTALEVQYKALQHENYSLREYIIHLQSRLIESQGDFPQPPPNVNLNQPRPSPGPEYMRAEIAAALGGTAPSNNTMGVSAINALQASAAQAVAGLAEAKHDPAATANTQLKTEPVRPNAEEELLKRQLQSAQDGPSQA